MADVNDSLKRAIDGPAPQHKVAGKDELELTEGSNGALHTKTFGSIVEDYYEGSSSYTKTYETPMHGVSIANDGLENLTFTINGITRTVYPGEPYNGTFKKAFTQIQINATDHFRLEVLS